MRGRFPTTKAPSTQPNPVGGCIRGKNSSKGPTNYQAGITDESKAVTGLTTGKEELSVGSHNYFLCQFLLSIIFGVLIYPPIYKKPHKRRGAICDERLEGLPRETGLLDMPYSLVSASIALTMTLWWFMCDHLQDFPTW